MARRKKTYAELERENAELRAGLPTRYSQAYRDIDKATISKCIGSGILLSLTALGGKEVIPSIMMKDGLSDETIAAIKKDIQRSVELTETYNTVPKGEVK